MQQPPLGQRSKGGTIAIRKEITHKTLNIRNAIQMVALPDRKGKEDSMFYIFTPNRPGNSERYERSYHMFAAPRTYDPAGRFQCTQSTMENRVNEHKREDDGKNTQQIQPLVHQQKEKTYYRTFDGSNRQ